MSTAAFRRWVCDACGYIYNEAEGDPDSGLPPGTRYQDIPEDWSCPLCGLKKSDLRILPEASPTRQKVDRPSIKSAVSRGGPEHVVIVGAGIAGWSVAEAIREQDAQTPVLLISACDGVSYPKPALSTAIAQGKQAQDLIELDALSHAANLDIEVRTETRIIKIDPRKKRLTTAKGGIQYGKLILALGAQQRQLPVDGDAAEKILRVNDLAAYRAMRQRLDQGVRHVTLLGAGLIGTEFAEDLCAGGYQVSVLDPAAYPLSGLLPDFVAQQLRDRLHQRGVQWLLGNTLDCLEHSGGRLRATLSSGEAIETDLVISAAGLVPNTALAAKTGLTIDKGIATDHEMRTSLTDIYAIGDCAAVDGQVYAYIEPIRRQAQTIAASLRGQRQPFDLRAPLIRVKTPSYPVTICPPSATLRASSLLREQGPGHVEYMLGDRQIGFVLSGDQADQGAGLYRSLLS